MKKVGVLALQGDFEAHGRAIAQAGGSPVYIRNAKALDNIDGLVLPGGESTAVLKLLHREHLFEPLRKFGQSRPIFGTCAGVILLAKEVTHPEQESLGLLDVSVERNGYGRQIDSAVAELRPAEAGRARLGSEAVEAVFIRAPVIHRTGPGVTVLAEYQGKPVLVEQGRHLGATFHPELSGDSRIHQLFLNKL